MGEFEAEGVPTAEGSSGSGGIVCVGLLYDCAARNLAEQTQSTITFLPKWDMGSV